jgi:diadenosine tetraphosphatase ApaH/serine/threonine PP2A family protein phosphatase
MIALFSDIHANIEALNACLAHARAQGATRYVFLGDIVGYCADPQAVVDVVAQLVAEGGVAVKGNHDAALENGTGHMRDSAREAIAWTLGVLSEPGRAFIASLPLCKREGDLCLVHASAMHPEKWTYVEDRTAAYESIRASGAIYTFSGHVHEQVLYSLSGVGKLIDFRPVPGSAIPVATHRNWLAIVGAVGQQRDGNPAASYAVFDEGHQAITFFRVPYDTEATARKIRAAGLPESLALQIERGS